MMTDAAKLKQAEHENAMLRRALHALIADRLEPWQTLRIPVDVTEKGQPDWEYDYREREWVFVLRPPAANKPA